MATDFKLPELGENIDSGDVVNVLVEEGQAISPGQNILELETGKAVVELPCPLAGRISKVHVTKGMKVHVGQVLLSLDSAASVPSEELPSKKSKATAESKSSPSKRAPAKTQQQPERSEPTEEPPESPPPPQPAASGTAGQVPARRHTDSDSPPPQRPAAAPPGKSPPAGPATRRLARELGVDLASVAGSGPGGRITEEDVKAAVRQTSSPAATAVSLARSAPLPEGESDRDKWGAIRRQKMTGIRKAIAQAMQRSASTIPHVTNFDEADITELERIRKGGLADYADSSVKLTMLAFVIKAVANALRLHPLLNASLDVEAEEILFKQYVHVGVAVDTERGLVVPVIRDADRLSIPRIAQALSTLAEKARGQKLSLEEMQGSTFTISNLGAVGGVYSTPIINPPNVAILLTGRSRKAPVVIDEGVQVRLLMPLSLSYDHRLVDGAAAARFLNEVIDYLAVPGRLLLAA